MRLHTLVTHSLLLCYILMPFSAAAQEAAGRLLIVEADSANAPELSVHFGLFDAQGQPIHDLQADEVAVTINGQPVTTPLSLALAEPRELAVAVVADFSAVMSDQYVPGQIRMRGMVEQIKQALRLLSNDSPVSLITFADQTQVAFDWRADITELRNTLDALAAQPLPSAAPDTPYALTEAIRLGLAQFDQPNNELIAGRPRALLVYTAGAPGHTIDSAALQGLIENLHPNPPTITLVGLGSGTPEEFGSQPGNPESLVQAAVSLPNTTFLRYYAANASDLTLRRNELNRRYNTILNTEQLYTLSFQAEALSTGAHSIDIAARGATASFPLRITSRPTRIEIVSDATLPPDSAQVQVNITASQRPIRQVEYFLNGQSIGVSTSEPNFMYNIDIAQLFGPEGAFANSDPADQQYELAAVATDVDGRQSKRARMQVRILPAQTTSDPPLPTWVIIVALVATILTLVLALVFVIFTQRQNNVKNSSVPIKEPDPFDNRTKVAINTRSNGGTTIAAAPVAAMLRVVVVDGPSQKTYPLQQGGEWVIGRKAGHNICLQNGQVSSDHARLKLVDGGVQLTDLKSTNGTFVGEDKRRVAPGKAEFVRFGEVFWLSSDVKLTVEQ